MDAPELIMLTLIRVDDADAYETFKCRREILRLDWNANQSVYKQLADEEARKARIFQPYVSGAPSADALYSVLKIFSVVGPAMGTCLGAWLHARYGRRVRVKVGDLEAEAQTPEEVEKLLSKAQEIQQRNEPKKIHEP